MWKRLADLARLLFTFGEGLQQNRAEIKELQREVRDLTVAVQQLSYEVRRVAENDAHERDKLALRLQNELLKFERLLPETQPKELTKPKTQE
jgi:uncharacterized protein YoxC